MLPGLHSKQTRFRDPQYLYDPQCRSAFLQPALSINNSPAFQSFLIPRSAGQLIIPRAHTQFSAYAQKEFANQEEEDDDDGFYLDNKRKNRNVMTLSQLQNHSLNPIDLSHQNIKLPKLDLHPQNYQILHSSNNYSDSNPLPDSEIHFPHSFTENLPSSQIIYQNSNLIEPLYSQNLHHSDIYTSNSQYYDFQNEMIAPAE